MLHKALIVIAVIAILIVIYLVVLGHLSRNAEPPGLVDGKLQPCPSTPNCVGSEYPGDDKRYVEPLELAGEPATDALQRLARIVEQQGGVIEARDANYLSAVFKSSVFGFADDFEASVDAAGGMLHIRSASRVGRDDFGANRERIEAIRKLWQAR